MDDTKKMELVQKEGVVERKMTEVDGLRIGLAFERVRSAQAQVQAAQNLLAARQQELAAHVETARRKYAEPGWELVDVMETGVYRMREAATAPLAVISETPAEPAADRD